MQETELKFQVPAAAHPAVRRAVATTRAESVRLQARYFDTPGRLLASAGIALRLRKEGPRWVQTLKTRGDGLMQRGEHEIALPPGRGVPVLDLARHDGTPAGLALHRVLGEDGAGELVEVFGTDIRRTRRQARARGTVIEIALDEGEIHVGQRRVPVCELEFELVRGPAAMLPEFAASWVERFGLWLDPRSKAEIGERLARGLAPSPVKAKAPVLHDAMPADDAFRAMLGAALEQVLANGCELASGSLDPEHLHQCRVGLRRLRCALRDLAPLAPTVLPVEAAAWPDRVRAVFARLGGARDRDALRESLVPQLVAAGAPLADLPPAPVEEDEPGAVLRDTESNLLWLAILGVVHAAPDVPPAGDPEPLSVQVAPILRKLHRRVSRHAAGFADLDEAAQHRTRKRLKRLRYAAEFCSSLYPHKAVARYLDALKPAQDALGDANDLVIARPLFESQLATDPRAWFVLGWLAARREQAVARCAQALACVAEARGFWRRRA